MTVTLTDAKAMKVRSPRQNLLLQKTATIRSVAEVIGFLVSGFPAVEFAEMHYRHLELDKNCALRANKGNFDSTMTLSAQSKTELTWWIVNVLTASKPIRHGNPDLSLTTDASKLGWGAVCGETSTGGFWSLEEQRYHINFLELKAVLLGLKSLCGAFSEKHILVQTDNTTAVAYINAMGEAGIDVTTFKPHSTRAAAAAAAASKAKNVSVPVKEILDTAGWSSERIFDCFYNEPFQKAGGFATCVLTID
ncbi:hypothetical protein AWC38_SpisGene18321 [Stylophora pistillata]|uniref:RNase H type-1 domain-containing protein n=1 Tax=Stylophora pistillata TaxID=50429 RepID=A0A2B4RJK7_STYPI|nr:hypothetical protein AWC38_SpisGene18321 [Stylophora pistillata]